MFTIGYFDGAARRGLLAYREIDGSPVALGGVTPEEQGYRESNAREPITVVSHDGEERMLSGWVHPDQITDVSGVGF